MTITEAVFSRHSSRTFEPELSEADSLEIDRILNRMPKRHFGAGMIGVRRIDCSDDISVPGTYGCIHGAHHYLTVFTSQAVTPLTLVDCGMIAELMALYITRAGMGTCLMTGSLRDSQFARLAGLGGGDSLLLAAPVGRARKPRLAEIIIGKMARSSTRLPLSRIAFTDRSLTTLWTPGDADESLSRALDGLRQAPSAFNSQPWRVAVGSDHIEILNSGSDSNSWISTGCAVTNYCAVLGIRSESLSVDTVSGRPVIVAPRP